MASMTMWRGDSTTTGKRSGYGKVLLAGGVLGVAACGSRGSDTPIEALTHEVVSTGSVVAVLNSGVAPRWNLEPVSTVGSEGGLEEPAPDEFGRITTVSTDKSGRLWVADEFGHDIRVFDTRGALVRRIGREGQGPGEFLSIYSLAWVDDVLLALDLGNGRVAELSETGEWLGTRPAPGSVGGRPATLRFYPVTDTTVLQWSLRPEEDRAKRVWVEHGPSGVSGEWAQLELSQPAPTLIRCEASGSRSYFDVPLGGRLHQHPAEGRRTYVVWTEEDRIALLNPTGDTLRIVEYDRPRVGVTEAEWAIANAEYSEFIATWPDARCEPRGVGRPALKPAIKNLLVDASGRLWVETYTEGGSEWDVFDSRGFLMGTVPGFDYIDRVVPSIRGDVLAWVESDSLGIERVQVARLVEEVGTGGDRLGAAR